MALTEKLNEFKKGFTENVPQDIQALMQQATQNLADSGIVLNTPKKGDKLAEFSLVNAQGTDVSLSSLLEDGPVVITFYRGGWCPYCNLALRAYQDSLAEIKALGATLVAITPELADASLSTTEKNELQFEVLTDTNAKYAKDLGLVFTLPEELRPIYSSFGIEVEEHNGANQFDLPLAATFVVAQDGTIASAFVEEDYTLRQEPSEVIKVLKSL
ncbi:peroxiredoxin-like family protein [Colwellia sp. C1TZA3]|uniref:peroxiredoxin-like family protein n=1 Tax=Colwellia sp. C1TZA3 TaxID=2508879 RepID=UPI0011B980A0|nr:peroxiredoxin-like family protein [Colwellia sp. C1TZA3]TWX70432.1 AhpC/TSA family protein [Colwellia sp. C1TZA3]